MPKLISQQQAEYQRLKNSKSLVGYKHMGMLKQMLSVPVRQNQNIGHLKPKDKFGVIDDTKVPDTLDFW